MIRSTAEIDKETNPKMETSSIIGKREKTKLKQVSQTDLSCSLQFLYASMSSFPTDLALFESGHKAGKWNLKLNELEYRYRELAKWHTRGGAMSSEIRS